MKPYKFRGWSIASKEWVYGSYQLQHNVCGEELHLITDIRTDTHNVTVFGYGNYDHFSNWGTFHEVIPETVGQFTGVLDSLKKEIYEGDTVLRIGSFGCQFIDEVYWDETKLGWCLSNSGTLCDFINRGKLEVIGNIHENKDLLKTPQYSL